MWNFVLSLSTVLVLGSRGQEEVCMKTGPCSCENVQGKIDLSPLASNDGKPRFFNISASNDPFYYSWNPCKDFSLPNTGFVCSSVAICQGYYVNPTPLYFNLGIQSDIMFMYDNTNTLTLQYVHNDNKTRISVIRLVCDAQEDGKLTIAGERSPTNLVYDLELRSKYACIIPFPATSTEPVTVTKATRGPPTTTASPAPGPGPDPKALDVIIFLLAGILLCLVLVLIVLVTLVTVLFCKLNGLHEDRTINKLQQYRKF